MSGEGQNNIKLEDAPVTMNQFLDNIQNEILAYVECGCGSKSFITSPICGMCNKEFQNAKWKIIETEGAIMSYCVTYVPPPELEDIAPYISLIADFGDGLHIPAMLKYDLNPRDPPKDLIGKKIKPFFISRTYGKILGMKLI